MKNRISQLTPKSEKILLKKMDLADLRTMAVLSSDVVYGRADVEDYWKKEDEMIIKYGFKLKPQKNIDDKPFILKVQP